MTHHLKVTLALCLGSAFVWSAAATCAAQNDTNPSDKGAAPWHDASPHTVRFVTVDKDVKLEVLDWGGSGRPLVLLAGLGNTAHIFDDFAPKLTSECHVYGITRRGFGASSAPVPEAKNYSADRRGDDVLAALDALKIEKAVLVGHSIAGEELSSVATRHPERVAGLVYLEAAYSYAYYDPSVGTANFTVDLVTLQRALDQLQKNPPQLNHLVDELLNEDMPAFEGDLHDWQKAPAIPPPTPPATATDADKENFATLRSWWVRTHGFAVPEGELRERFESMPDGRVGESRDKTLEARLSTPITTQIQKPCEPIVSTSVPERIVGQKMFLRRLSDCGVESETPSVCMWLLQKERVVSGDVNAAD